MVGDRLLDREQLVRAADALAHPRLVELAGQRGRDLRHLRDERDAVGQPADRRGEVAGADRDERQVRVGEPHELRRLARRRRLRALAGIEHGLPAAPLQRGVERLRPLDRDGPDRPAGLVEGALHERRVSGGHVDEQRAD